MASYSLSYRQSVEKDLQPIPRVFVVRIVAKIERLPSEPFPAQSAQLQGAERLWAYPHPISCTEGLFLEFGDLLIVELHRRAAVTVFTDKVELDGRLRQHVLRRRDPL